MIQESKQIRKVEKLMVTDDDDDDDEDDGDNNDCINFQSQLSMPSPSKIEIDEIKCDGLLKSQKANVDELSYLIRGMELKNDENDLNENGNDNNETCLMLTKLKNLINIGLWLKHEQNQIILDGTNKYIVIILNNLRNLSRIYINNDIMICSITAILFILIETGNIKQCNDVSINILLRFIQNKNIRNNSIKKDINDIINSLKLFNSKSSKLMSRKNRRNKNKISKTIKLIDDFKSLFIIDDDNDNIDIDNIYKSSIEYLCSYLLIKIITNNKENKCIINYINHPTVIYKLASIVQFDCIKLENQIFDIKYIENMFNLLALITN